MTQKPESNYKQDFRHELRDLIISEQLEVALDFAEKALVESWRNGLKAGRARAERAEETPAPAPGYRSKRRYDS